MRCAFASEFNGTRLRPRLVCSVRSNENNSPKKKFNSRHTARTKRRSGRNDNVKKEKWIYNKMRWINRKNNVYERKRFPSVCARVVISLVDLILKNNKQWVDEQHWKSKAKNEEKGQNDGVAWRPKNRRLHLIHYAYSAQHRTRRPLGGKRVQTR